MALLETKDPRLISHQTLRKAVGWLGILLPAALLLGNAVFGRCTTVQSSISHCYYTATGDLLVGVLCAVALFLFTYKGYSRTDRIATSLAGFFAVLVALFPTDISTMASPNVDRRSCFLFTLPDNAIRNGIHYGSAALFFLTLAYISLFLFTRSRHGMTQEKKTRNKIYIFTGIVILLSIALIGLYDLFAKETSLAKHKPVFWLEWIALVAFGVSWLIKGELFFRDRVEKNKVGGKQDRS